MEEISYIYLIESSIIASLASKCLSNLLVELPFPRIGIFGDINIYAHIKAAAKCYALSLLYVLDHCIALVLHTAIDIAVDTKKTPRKYIQRWVHHKVNLKRKR